MNRRETDAMLDQLLGTPNEDMILKYMRRNPCTFREINHLINGFQTYNRYNPHPGSNRIVGSIKCDETIRSHRRTTMTTIAFLEDQYLIREMKFFGISTGRYILTPRGRERVDKFVLKDQYFETIADMYELGDALDLLGTGSIPAGS